MCDSYVEAQIWLFLAGLPNQIYSLRTYALAVQTRLQYRQFETFNLIGFLVQSLKSFRIPISLIFYFNWKSLFFGSLKSLLPLYQCCTHDGEPVHQDICALYAHIISQ